MRDGLLHNGGVHRDLGQAARRHGPAGTTRLDSLGKQPLHALLADAAAPAAERGGMDRRTVLEEGLTREVLEVRVLHPAREHRLVGEAMGVLEVHQPGDQTRMRGRPSLSGGEEAGPFPLEPGPVDQRRQPHQFVPPIDHVDQPRPQQIGLFRRARAVLHAHKIRRVCRRKQSNPANPGRRARKISQLDQCLTSYSRPTIWPLA